MRHATITRNVLLTLGLPVLLAMGPSAGGNQTAQKPEPTNVTLPDSVAKFSLVSVPGGTVEVDGKKVQVKPFLMATTETTWEAFDVFLASGPPSPPYDETKFTPDAIARPSKCYILPDMGWGHRGYPVINVNFTSAEMYCRWLSSVTGKKYRLPTAAEWELAARGGTSGAWKLSPEDVEKQSWNDSNSDGTTHPVGSKAANTYGIFDLLGNVGEWATDEKGEPVLCGASFDDPAAQVSPTLRRKFSPKWQESDPQMPKSRWWLTDGPFVGFRVVQEP